MDFKLDKIIYLNLNSKAESKEQLEKIAFFFEINFSAIQIAIDLKYSFVYIDSRNSEIIAYRYENEIYCFLENYEGNSSLNEDLLFDNDILNEICTINYEEVICFHLDRLSQDEIELLGIRFYLKNTFWALLKRDRVKIIWWNYTNRKIVALVLEKDNEFMLTDYFIYFDNESIAKLNSIVPYSILTELNYIKGVIINFTNYQDKINFLKQKDIPSLKILEEITEFAVKIEFFELAIPLKQIIDNCNAAKS